MPSVVTFSTAIFPNKVTPPAKLKEGNALCTQMLTIAQLAQKWSNIALQAKKQAPEVVCTGATAALGLSQIWQGNYLTGLSMTTAAALNIFKMYKGNSTPFTQILENAKSSTDLIKTLEEANKNSEKRIDAYLTSLKEGQSRLAQERAEIARLAKGASQEVAGKVDEALLLLGEAESLFDEAEKQLVQCREDIVSAELAFIQIRNGLQAMIEAAHQPLTEEMPHQIKEQAEMMCQLCSGGNEVLAKVLESEAKCQRLLNAARQKQNEAAKAYGAAIEIANKNLKEIALIAANKALLEQNQELLLKINQERSQNERRRKEQAAILRRHARAMPGRCPAAPRI